MTTLEHTQISTKSYLFSQIAPPTLLGTPVNHNTKWTKLTYPPVPPITQIPTNTWTINPKQCLPLKYPPQFCYYTNGSFKPPKQTNNGQWKREKEGYGIYNPFKNLKNSKKITGTTKYPTSRNDGHTPQPTTPHHNIPK